ncbi:hypothetical protein Q095_00357 [Pseudomonas aeruginosa PS50]|uniref:hypothetical protein n=1 Tax=Pseudomonas aeruginosa TaxID=287 RepID=UPI00044CE6FF|nr:hypothetical protein [Pseudomonas aeruginosa]ETU79904.1 hypothetical protein Q095_00357 [Pseudomonas aeruginosa PS50]
MFNPQVSEWEISIVAAITKELDQLRYLIDDKSGSTEKGDIRAQIDRLCGLTDLAHNQAIPFSASTRLQIREVNEMAMGMIRTTLDFTPPTEEFVQSVEREAAQGMFDAIALNLPNLAQAETSKYAIALSTNAFDLMRTHMGDHPDFEMMERLVLVQDYRVMKLAGDNR